MPFQKGREKTGGKVKGTINGQTLRKLAGASGRITATIDRVLEEYEHIAFLDIGDAFDEHGNLLPIHQIPEGIRRAMAGIEVADLNIDRGGKGSVGKLHKIKILDKWKALQDIGRHLGMFIEQVNSTVTILSNRETLAKELDERRRKRLSSGS